MCCHGNCSKVVCVVTVTAAKPNPPHQLGVTALNSSNYTYLVEWAPPISSSWNALNKISYQVQITYSAQGGYVTSCSVFPEIRQNSVIFDAKNDKGLPDCVMCLDKYQCGNDLLAILNVSVIAFYPDTPLVTSDGASTCFSVREGEGSDGQCMSMCASLICTNISQCAQDCNCAEYITPCYMYACIHLS